MLRHLFWAVVTVAGASLAGLVIGELMFEAGASIARGMGI